MTRQRALILEILQHSPKHLTADEIFAIAREKMPGIARGRSTAATARSRTVRGRS